MILICFMRHFNKMNYINNFNNKIVKQKLDKHQNINN